jgi:hypothetical protein
MNAYHALEAHLGGAFEKVYIAESEDELLFFRNCLDLASYTST